MGCGKPENTVNSGPFPHLRKNGLYEGVFGVFPGTFRGPETLSGAFFRIERKNHGILGRIPAVKPRFQVMDEPVFEGAFAEVESGVTDCFL